MDKHVFGPPKGSSLRLPDPPRAKLTKKKEKKRQIRWFVVFFGRPKKIRQITRFFFFLGIPPQKTTNYLICCFFWSILRLGGLGAQGSSLWEARKHVFPLFSLENINLEAGGQREYPFGGQRGYALGGPKTMFFFHVLWKLAKLEAGGQREYPLGSQRGRPKNIFFCFA